MNTQIERTGNTLFPDAGGRVVNVKFFLGTTRDVTREQLVDQLDRADAQVRQGAAIRITDVDNYQPC